MYRGCGYDVRGVGLRWFIGDVDTADYRGWVYGGV